MERTTTNHLGEKDYFEYDEDNYLTLRGNDQEEMKFEYTEKGLLKKLTNQFDQTKELRYNIYRQPTLIKEFAPQGHFLPLVRARSNYKNLLR